MERLGALSAKYESNNNPARVSQSNGDGGGWSYGIYQFASAAGVVQNFIHWLCQHEVPYDEYGRQLASAGDPSSDQSFVDKWEDIGNTDADGFAMLQDEYVKPQYYDAGAEKLIEWYNFDISQHSNALQQVLFSNCIQHGTYYGAQVFGDAAKFVEKDLNSMNEADIINFIYEVKLTDMSWSSGSPQLRPGLFARWKNEREDALVLLNKQT
ncbi:VgrG-related protein [Propionispira raffinosivorans]|uniref:VgrG-related protein n=1 Tax=Propionispira raffinosivorans TaxID=86959 RepID=UPI00037C9A99|nr:hypothetical protein [Propionispira raffinosivorans]